MRLPPDLRGRAITWVACFLMVATWASRSLGGPAKYDPKTRSFSLTYTYASLPHFGMTPSEVETLGSLQEPSRDQDDKVRALHQAVSQVISEITGGRAKIGSLEYVKNIKNADIVVSLTGNFNRAGWAISGAIEGRPGQVGLYYQYMAAPERSKQDVILTVAHELGHYLFSLPDEYSNRDPTAASCPLKNPGGPGCLMDNYMTRHGYLALCSDNDHNANGPRQNPGTIVQGHTANDSCSELVDRFFKDHPPAPISADPDDAGAGVGATSPSATAASSQPRPSADNPFTGRFGRVVDAAVSFVREEVDRNVDADGKPNKLKRPNRPAVAASSSELSVLTTLAKNFLNEQVDALRSDPDFIPISKAQFDDAIKLVVKRASVRHVDRPVNFTRDIVNTLRDQAKLLANQELSKIKLNSSSTSFLRMLMGNQDETDKQLQPTVKKVTDLLAKFALTAGRKALIGFSPPTKLTPEEQRYVEQLAREAVKGTSETSSDFTTYFEAAKLHTRLTLNASETLNAVASELNLPGAEKRKIALDELTTQLDKFALPGKPFLGPGFRRTFIIAPQPIDPAMDYLPIDAGDRIPYHTIRNLALTQFMSLIQRERLVFLNDPTTIAPIGALRPATGTTDFGPPPEGLDSGQRFARQVALLNALSEEIRGDRVENIIILAPPGGFAEGTDDAIEVFRQRVSKNAGVRVDLVLLGSHNVPLRLRDLVHKSGGTVQTGIDIDETGAISQRLKNELGTGSWVVRPEQGYIDLSPLGQQALAEVAKAANGGNAPKEKLNVVELQERYVGLFRNLQRDSAEYKRAKQQGYDRNDNLDPFLLIAKGDLSEFSTHLDMVLSHFVKTDLRPDSYDRDVRGTLTRLADLKQRLERIDSMMGRLDVRGSTTTQARLDAILKEIIALKGRLRLALTGEPMFDSPLKETDDYLDWTLRNRLLSRAAAIEDLVQVDGKGLPEAVQSDLLVSAALLVRRATLRDARLADIDRLMYRASSQRWVARGLEKFANDEMTKTFKSLNPVMLNGKQLEEGLRKHDAWKNASLKARHDQEEAWTLIRKLAATAEKLERTSSSNIPQAPELLLHAADLLEGAFDKIKEAKRTDRSDLFHAHYILDRDTSFLERASRLGVDLELLSGHVAKLRLQVADFKTLFQGTSEKNKVAMSAELDAKLDVLNKRVEAMIVQPNRQPMRPAIGPVISEPEGSALRSIMSALNEPELLEKKWGLLSCTWPQDSMWKDRNEDVSDPFWFREPKDKMLPLASDIVTYRISDMIDGDFPELLLSLLGHIRKLELDVVGTQEQLLDQPKFRSPSDRLGDRRERAKVELSPTRTGSDIEITFKPFQTEREADYEIVLGLTRPLRNFEAVKLEPPTLRLYREGALEEKPYLNFVPEVSTATMLVYRAPKPDMRAGVLGAGLYTPKLLMNRDYFPIVGRDNTIGYTFTVATRRPNVQLIAALRQPQPKEGPNGEIDPVKDPEFAFRGTLPANLTEAIVEVQVLAGASVRNAAVTGFYQRVDETTKSIDSPNITFLDDGIAPDSIKGDGVYTARITLIPPARRTSAEYRVMIQAVSTKDVAFIPLAEGMPRREGTEKADLSTEAPAVPPFQRATSLNFHVAKEN